MSINPELRDNIKRYWKESLTFILKLSAHAALIASLYLLYEAIFNQSLDIRAISTPKPLSDSGISPEVVAVRLRDQINSTIESADTKMKKEIFVYQSDIPDIEVPSTGLTVKEIAHQICHFFHIKEKSSISGEITMDGDLIFIRIRAEGKLIFTNEQGVDRQHFNNLLADAAQAILRKTQPYILADIQSEKQPELALQAVDKIVTDLPPSDIQVKWALALKCRILNNLHRNDQAIEFCRQATWTDPYFPMAYNNLGVVFDDLGQGDRAIVEYRTAIALDRNFAYPHTNLGMALSALHRQGEAMEEFYKAIDIDSKFAKPHNSLGVVLFDAGRYKEAEAQFRSAITIDPKDPDPHNNLGFLLEYSKRYKEAIFEYRAASEANPTYAKSHYNLSKLFLALGQRDNAVPEYLAGFAIDPNDEDVAVLRKQLTGFSTRP